MSRRCNDFLVSDTKNGLRQRRRWHIQQMSRYLTRLRKMLSDHERDVRQRLCYLCIVPHLVILQGTQIRMFRQIQRDIRRRLFDEHRGVFASSRLDGDEIPKAKILECATSFNKLFRRHHVQEVPVVFGRRRRDDGTS